MNQEQFVEAIRMVVMESASVGVLQQLRRPSGRRPAEELGRLSAWFNALPDSDKDAVAGVARLVSHSAVFGLFCVLDGVRTIEDGPEKGSLTLVYRNGDLEVPLNGPDQEFLHDLLNAE